MKTHNKEDTFGWKKSIENFQKGKYDNDPYRSVVEDRLNDILCVIAKVHGHKNLNWWYVDGAEVGSTGNILSLLPDSRLGNDSVCIESIIWDDKFKPKDKVKIIYGNTEYTILYEFPFEWMLMETYDIEAAIAEGRKEYEAKQQVQKDKRTAATIKRKLQKANLINSIKSKLTPEEIKFLKI